MHLHRLNSFGQVGLGQRVTALVPNYQAALGRVQLQMDGTAITKATSSALELLVGSRSIIGPVSGTVLDALMKFRGQYDHSRFLTLDLCERNGRTLADREIGAIDIPGLGGDPIFVAHTNSAGAGSPTLEGVVGFVGRQRKVDEQGNVKAQSQLVHKLKRYDLGTGSRITWNLDTKGAWIKRVHFQYGGTDWATNTDGNLATVEVKLAGRPVHDRIGCLRNRFWLQENGLVPQSKFYHLDFIADGNVIAKALKPGRASVDFVLELTASDTVTAFVEFLDRPGNL